MHPAHLSDAELIDVTRRKMHSAQARALAGMGVPYKVRPDGSLLVGRTALEHALCAMAATKPPQDASNGITWSKRA